MKKSIPFIIFPVIILLILIFLFWKSGFFKSSQNQLPANNQSTTASPGSFPSDSSTAPAENPVQNNTVMQNNNSFIPPLSRASERVTKKPFGIFITPQTSPVQPERFRGYHTGADFEIFPEELNIDVPVRAICSGKSILKEYASGYGGVAVESCTLNNSPITVIYGHLKLASIALNASANITQGDIIGILGASKSVETDGERKHLHLGIHKGSGVSILGYVQSQSALSGWIDPCPYVCHD